MEKLRRALRSGLAAGRKSNLVWPNIADKNISTNTDAVPHELEIRERDITFLVSIGISIFSKDGGLLSTQGKEVGPGWSAVVICRMHFEPAETYTSDDNELLLKIDPGQQCKVDLLNVLYGLKSGGIVLPILYHEQERARDLVYGFNGDPASVAGNYWRMLYLSVVIITTLGLGDIIPLSSMARGLVGAEAVCGIVLMGLFLNAIALARIASPLGMAYLKRLCRNDAKIKSSVSRYMYLKTRDFPGALIR